MRLWDKSIDFNVSLSSIRHSQGFSFSNQHLDVNRQQDRFISSSDARCLRQKLIIGLFLVDQVNLHGFASDPDDVRVEEWQGSGAVSALAQVVRRYPLVAELLAPSKDERPVMSWSPKGGSLAIVGKEQFICCRI